MVWSKTAHFAVRDGFFSGCRQGVRPCRFADRLGLSDR
jgi:hypothetical protein